MPDHLLDESAAGARPALQREDRNRLRRTDALYIVAIHVADGGEGHGEVRGLRLRHADAVRPFEATPAEVAAWIEQRHADVRLVVEGREVQVDVTHDALRPIQAVSNSDWTDDLLSLPRY
jgi:hypothetical protein